MNAELENKLADTFPFMKRKKKLNEQMTKGMVCDLYGAFGCECHNGWYDVIYKLCAEITEVYKKHNQPVDIVIEQVKEKYGTLRFYYHHEKKDKGINAADFSGESTQFSSKDSELYREISDIVDKWEKKSGEICEECGEPGVLRDDLSWILTLCDDCYYKVQEKSHKRFSANEV